MIQSVEVTSKTDHAIIELSNPEGFLITDIMGVDSPIGSINMNENAITDGAVFNGARANGRNIVISLRFIEGFFGTIEELRHRCYKLFPVKSSVELVFTTDTRVIKSTGYVETNSTHIFEENEGAQISILCEDAYFSDEESTDAVFNDSEALFEPPFENYVANGVNYVKRPYYHTESYVTNVNFVKYPFSTASGTSVAGLQYTWSDSVTTPTINVSGTYDGSFPAYAIYDLTKRNGIMQGLGAGKASINMPFPFVLQYGDSSGAKGTLLNEVAGTHYFEITKEMLMYNLGLTSFVNAPQGQTYATTIQPKIYKYGRYINGIMWNINSDGSVTANGTATAVSDFIAFARGVSNFPLEAGTYLLSGAPSGSSSTTYSIYARLSGSSGPMYSDYGSGTTFTLDSNEAKMGLYLRVNSGQTVNNLTFRPMISKNDSLIRDNAVKMPYMSPNHHYNNNGVFDVNPDGSVTASTPDGATTNASYFYMLHRSYSNDLFKRLGVGTFRLSGAPDSDATSLVLAYGSSSAFIGNLVTDNGNGATFTIYENFVKQPYFNASGYTNNGITYTINSNGSITANGTANADSSFYFTTRTQCNDILERMGKGTFTLSGCPSGGSSSKYLIIMNYGNASQIIASIGNDTGNGFTFTINDDITMYNFQMLIRIRSGQTVNNLTFKPMLERGSVAHEYMPDLTYYNGCMYYMLRTNSTLSEPLTCYPQITQGEIDTPYMYTTTKYDESLQAYVPKLPDTRTIELSNYAKEHYKVINYDGDVAAGFIVEISITGNNVKDLTIANSTTHTMMRIDDDELPTEVIVGEGLKKGDFIRIDTRTRHKSIILIRDAVEYNILSALTTNSTWLKLENGENMIRFVASQGKNDVKMKLIYNNLYEGV